jgi:selenocysteine lyase/cysteine desulfurase
LREALDRRRGLSPPHPAHQPGDRRPPAFAIEGAHDRGVPVLLDAAQLAAHRPPRTNADFLPFSGHNPHGAGALIGRRSAFADCDPFLAGGGAVDVVWARPARPRGGRLPNVLGAVALGAAMHESTR